MPTLVLFQPQIPPNTGNIMRLCSNTGFKLHLIRPLGFNMDEKSLKRAKLDYLTDTDPIIYNDLETYCKEININNLFIVTKFAKMNYTKANFKNDSIIMFGSEISGLPKKFIKSNEKRLLKIPMLKGSRSLNLSNAVAIIAYEAWKKLNFSGADL